MSTVRKDNFLDISRKVKRVLHRSFFPLYSGMFVGVLLVVLVMGTFPKMAFFPVPSGGERFTTLSLGLGIIFIIFSKIGDRAKELREFDYEDGSIFRIEEWLVVFFAYRVAIFVVSMAIVLLSAAAFMILASLLFGVIWTGSLSDKLGFGSFLAVICILLSLVLMQGDPDPSRHWRSRYACRFQQELYEYRIKKCMRKFSVTGKMLSLNVWR